MAMVDYLERQQEQKRKEQQKAMRDELQKLIKEAEWEQKITEREIHHFKMGTLKFKSGLYSTYAKYLLRKSLDHCNSETSLSKMASTFAQEIEGQLQKLSARLATMKTLLEKDYIGKEDLDNCQAEATILAETDRAAHNVEDRMWRAYRDMCLLKLLDISKKAMYSDPEFTTGK